MQAHIIAAAEFTNCGIDAGKLLVMLRTVQANLGAAPEQLIADTGCKADELFGALAYSGCELVVTVGREGKHPLRFDAQRSPDAAAMEARFQTEQSNSPRPRTG